MSWQPVGVAVVGPTTDAVTLGLISVPLDGGFLKLRIRSGDGASQRPLSFGIVEPVAGFDGGGVPSGRYYPSGPPSFVALGPGLGSTFSGAILFRPRAYNLRWLKAGIPASRWSIEAEVFAPAGEVAPWWTPGRFRKGLAELLASGETVGTAGAAPLTYA